MFTERMIERIAVLGYISPSNHAANTDTSIAGIDMSCIRRLLTIVDVGAVGTNANVQIYYRASALANMGSPSNVASAIPITTNTSDRIQLLEVRADQLPANTRYVQPVIVVNTAATFLSVTCIGEDTSYKPGSQFTITNTVENATAT